MKRSLLSVLVLALIINLVSCGGGESVPISLRTKPVSVKIYDTPKGADPAVSAEMGGKGFEALADKLGYETYIGENEADPAAKKGGRITTRITEFPASLRTVGKDSNYDVLSSIDGLVYERLMSYEYKTSSFTRGLATHWYISEDQKTFRYRINPDARWSDGKPVTAEDVVASWKLNVDEGILEPYSNMLYSKYSEPKAISKYIVETSVTEDNWRLFFYFSVSMGIMPAHHLNDVTGAEYLKKYQFDMMPGSGPYVVDSAKVKKGKSLTLVRRNDWWGANLAESKGAYNFDEIKFIVVSDDRLTLEKFKKGEIDINFVTRAQWWVEEFDETRTDFDALHRGLIQKQKTFNFHWKGISGLAFNMRRAPFNDIKIRKAFARLWNRDLLIDKLFFNEYGKLNSYFPGGIYQNQNNPMIEYDPEEAIALLAEAGWKDRDNEGWLVKDGKIFELEMGIDQSLERIFTPYQEELAKAGIKLNLRYVTSQTMFKNVMNERDFDIHYQGWTGLMFPNPESSFHSNMADVGGTTNITGLKDPRVDALCDEYNESTDAKRRVDIIREMDGIIADIEPYALGWFAPYTQRYGYWNKFGIPANPFGYSGDWKSLFSLWYIKPDMAVQVDKAMKDPSMTFPYNKHIVTAEK